MATGTATTEATYDWQLARSSGNGTAADISGDPIIIPSDLDPTHPQFGPLTAAVWCHIDPVTGIPAGATITQIDVTMTVQQSSGTSNSPPTAESPRMQFDVESAILHPGFFYGGVGAGGPGDLPADTSVHTITYDGLLYPSQSGGGGVQNFDAWPAALLAGDPLSLLLEAQVVQDGESMSFYQPIVFTFYWETAGATVVPPLRQHPRSDGLGTSSARRVYPPAPSIQASNRRAGGYL